MRNGTRTAHRWLLFLVLYGANSTAGATTPEDPILTCTQSLALLGEHIRVLQAEEARLREALEQLRANTYQSIEDRPLSDLSPEERLLAPVTKLQCSNRVNSALRIAGIHTLGQLVTYRRKDFFFRRTKIRNLGETSVDEIETRLAIYGLQLKPDR